MRTVCKKIRRSFTLVEIIAVLAIMAILGATVIPYYANLNTGAELATIEAVRGELQARANQYYAAAILDATSADGLKNAWTSTQFAADATKTTGANPVGDQYTIAGPTATTLTVTFNSNIYTIAFAAGDNTASSLTPGQFKAITGP